MPSKLNFGKWRTLLNSTASLFDRMTNVEIDASCSSAVRRTFAPNCADEVRVRLTNLGVAEQDVAAAVNWSREARIS